MCQLNPRIDFAFKKLFGSEKNKSILIAFINAVVSKENQISDVILQNPYNAKNHKKDKLSILDIKGFDEKGHIYNIEMQITDEFYYRQRSIYYWARLYSNQLSEGETFNNLKKTISINILNFNYLPEEHFHNIYKIINKQSHQELSDHLEMHFIELEKFNKPNDQLKTTLDRWITFLKKAHLYKNENIPEALKRDTEIMRAIATLDTLFLTDDEREIYESQLKWWRDEMAAIITAELRGHEKGHAEGHAKGHAEGQFEKAKSIAITMLQHGLSIEFVAETTGLNIETIKMLTKSLISL